VAQPGHPRAGWEGVIALARIRSLQRGTQDVHPHPSEVDCFYQVVQTNTGTKLLHLTTFGSDARQSAAKSSQSLQIDESTAAELLQVIYEVYPGLRT
jgi:hypothetical protein